MEHICHNKKCIFVHVPKAAGRSVAESLGWDRNLYGGHHRALYLRFRYKRVYENYFVFSFCRDPLTRAISAFNYFKNSKTFQRQSGDRSLFKAVDESENFDQFCKKFLFDKNPLDLIDHFKPQHYFLCDAEDKILVDFLGRFESIEKDFKIIAEKLNVSAELEHRNKGLQQQSVTKETKNIIKKIYEKDFKIFYYK